MPEMTAHPSQDQLSAYNLGQLPQDEAVAIESHISECEPCCDTIISLSTDDTFVGLLKEARQLQTDQTLDHAVATASSSCQNIPVQLAEHPRYEILGLIGKGGMGDVYEAIHRKMERRVALKVINRKLFQKTEAVNRFHREVKTAAQLSHPNIVTAFDADQADDFHFMVMEFVDGVDLAEIVKDQGALPLAEACDYIRQAAIGLQHAHERGMVHRDIKPHNLMVTSDGTIKILDFGLASLAPESVVSTGATDSRGDLTVAGAIMGTPDFISPEQAQDARRADHRSDIYSLGATLYYLLAGRPPFAGNNVAEKLKSLAENEPESLATLRGEIPTELVAIVHRMTAKDPEDRFGSASEVAEALAPFAEGLTACEDSPQLQPKRRKPRFLSLTAIAALFFGLIAAGVVFYVQTDNGVVRIDVASESLEVDIDGQTVTVDNDDKPLEIKPGKHALTIRQGDFTFETKKFEVSRNGATSLKVELLEGQIIVSENGATFDRSGAKLLVGQWRGKMGGSDEELRVAFQSDGSFELDIRNPTKVEVRAIGTYSTDFSVAPAQLDLDATTLEGPSAGSKSETPLGGTPAQVRPEHKELVKQKIEAIIELVDANTLRISDLDASSRPKSFGLNSVVLRRQGSGQYDRAVERVRISSAGPFSYDLSQVPVNAREIYGFRPQAIHADGRFATLSNALKNTSFAAGVDHRLAEVLAVKLPSRDGTLIRTVMIMNVAEGEAKDFAFRELAKDSEMPGDVRPMIFYPAKQQGQFFQVVDDKTICMGTHAALNDFGFQVMLLKREPNTELLKAAASMLNGPLFFIGNSKDKRSLEAIKQEGSENPLKIVAMSHIPLWQDTSYLTLSLSMGANPQLRCSAHALSADKQAVITQAMNVLHFSLANRIRSMTSIGESPIESNSADAVISALREAEVTEPSETETLLTVSLKEAEPHLLKILNSYAGKLDQAKTAAYKAASVNNLRQISMAFLMFEEEHGYLPSVTTNLPGAKHPVSWRVAILKYLDEDLYNQYKLDEPWYSDNNKTLLAKIPSFYRHPGQEEGITTTCYVTLVGENTATGNGETPITDSDAARTILITECYTNIPWTKPEDHLVEDEKLLPRRRPLQDGWNVVFVDGSAQFLSAETSAEEVRALINRDAAAMVPAPHNAPAAKDKDAAARSKPITETEIRKLIGE